MAFNPNAMCPPVTAVNPLPHPSTPPSTHKICRSRPRTPRPRWPRFRGSGTGSRWTVTTGSAPSGSPVTTRQPASSGSGSSSTGHWGSTTAPPAATSISCARCGNFDIILGTISLCVSHLHPAPHTPFSGALLRAHAHQMLIWFTIQYCAPSHASSGQPRCTGSPEEGHCRDDGRARHCGPEILADRRTCTCCACQHEAD